MKACICQFYRSTVVYRVSAHFGKCVNLCAHEHTVLKFRSKAILFLIDTGIIWYRDAAYDSTLAAVAHSVSPNPELKYNGTRAQHTQTANTTTAA